jgi:hypothetical protein
MPERLEEKSKILYYYKAIAHSILITGSGSIWRRTTLKKLQALLNSNDVLS